MSENFNSPKSSRDIIKGALQKISELEKVIANLKEQENEPIAVIGMGCRFPGDANTPEALWELLQNGRHGIQEVPLNRWDIDFLYDANVDSPGKMNTRLGGFLNNVDQFDPGFFGISPREALSMDPQQRLLLEVTWEAIENANISPKDLYGTSTGVFIGIIAYDYGQRLLGINPLNQIDAYVGTGASLGVAAGRISYTFGMNGPSFIVDTACSSSLVSTHLACESLRRKESNLAITGGVNLMLEPGLSINFSKAHMLSSDGICKTFDESADGYVRGEGCGVLVLKRLSDAVRDHDPILALIKGSAVNQDGASGGLTVPSGPSQVKVMQQALVRAGLKASDIDYIEAHGTGTALGDPIELGSIDQVFGFHQTAKKNIHIGSIKTNLGHLEASAGVAGLIKVILALQKEKIPPHLNCKQPTSRFPWDKKNLKIVRALQDWPRNPDSPRRAGVSSFGFSGTNAHVLLEEAPSQDYEEMHLRPKKNALHLFNISAQNPAALHQLVIEYLKTLENTSFDLAEICNYAANSRSQLPCRLSTCGQNIEEIKSNLQLFVKNLDCENVLSNQGVFFENRQLSSIAFLFTGQGSQYPTMGAELYQSQVLFKNLIDDCAKKLEPYCDISLQKLLFETSAETLNQSIYTQPALFCLEYALAKFWQALGIHPTIMIGHSLGEYVAACLAEVFSLNDAIRIVTKRAQLMQALPKNGGMAVIFSDISTVQDAIRSYSQSLSIAAVNSKENIVISGEITALQTVLSNFEINQIAYRELPVSHAFHSQLMEPMLENFKSFMSQIPLKRAKIPFISNVTGKLIDDQVISPDYWVLHIRNAVLFAAGIEELQQLKINTYLEIGPNPTLIGLVKQQHEESLTLFSLKSQQSDLKTFFYALANFNILSHAIKWSSIYPRYRIDSLALPNYAFQRNSFWIARENPQFELLPTKSIHPLLGYPLSLPAVKQNEMRFEKIFSHHLDYLQEHEVNGKVIYPATAYIEMILASRDRTLSNVVLLKDFSLQSPLIFKNSHLTKVQLVQRTKDTHVEFEIFSTSGSSELFSEWQLHASSKLDLVSDFAAPIINFLAIQEQYMEQIDPKDFYEDCKLRGIHYGTQFQLITEIWCSPNSALAKIKIPLQLQKNLTSYTIHPTILDACFQTVFVTLSTKKTQTWLPIGFSEMQVFGTINQDVYCQVHLKTQPDQAIQIADLLVFTSEGTVVNKITNLTAKLIQSWDFLTQVPSSTSVKDLLYEVNWQLEPIVPEVRRGQFHEKWLIFADNSGLASQLAKVLQKEQIQHTLLVAGVNFVEKQEHVWEIDPQNQLHFQQFLTLDRLQNITHCVYLWGLDIPKTFAFDMSLSNQLHLAWQAPLFFIQALHEKVQSNPLRLIFISRNAVSFLAKTSTVIGTSPLWGIAQSITVENPHWHCQSIDFSEISSESIEDALHLEAMHIFDELNQDQTQGIENQVIYRDDKRYVSRLQNMNALKVLPSTSSYGVTIPKSGNLTDLIWEPQERPAPGLGEVEIEVAAAGLNFKDVLLSLHRVPSQSPLLGVECSGTITRIGPDVKHFQIGQRVIAMVPGCFARFVCAPSQTTVPMPEKINFSTGAALPIAFLTAAYALHSLGRLQAGERVLIHAATGGVGQAAIQIAQRAGAIVFATASLGKWSVLKSLGVEYIFDSRTAEFESAIVDLTDGKGVDLVLNSLRGELTDAGLRLLRPGGRFLEIGITDLRQAEELEQIAPGIAYYPIDLMQIYRDDPGILESLFADIMEQMATDELRALPVQTFAASQIEQAFRTMQLAKHTGKLVLTLENSTLQCNATSSYLIVGGLGDLGLATCQFLINHGAKYVTLLGRSEIRPHKLDLIDGFKKQGVTVRIISADLNNPEELQEVLQVTNTEQNPLRGIIHCAGVLDDGMMSQLTPDRFLKVFQPKIDLTWQLHLKTLAMPLDFFILYSSAASLLGSPGQSNYVIANTFLDRFACYRRSLGLKATVVNWGAWSDIGFAARLDLKEKLLLQGVEMLSTVEAFDALAQLLPLDTPQIGVMRIDWKRYLANNLHRSFYKNLTQFSDASESQETESFSTLFIQTPLPERSYLMNNFLSDTLKSVLRFNENHQFDQKQGFLDLGMDSLTSVEFKNRLSSSLNLSLAATIVFDYPNILTLSDYLLNRLNQHPTSQTIQSSSMLSNEMENILGLSEDEAEESLRITLNEMGFEIK